MDWLSAQQQHGGSVQYQDNTLAVTQFSSEDETVSVIVAWFNDAGDLIDVELSADVKLEVGKPKTMNVNGSENKGKNVKIFVWNNLINMQAKCGTISGTEGNAIREYGIPWIAPSPKK